jgi:putative acetyltransferase
MITLIRTNAQHHHFIELVRELDAELAVRDGREHDFYNQFNTIDMIKYTVVAYEENKPVGCGAIKEYAPAIMEIKRIYTLPDSRGKGIAYQILKELETWSKEMNYEKCILETGKKQPEAIALYQKSSYKQIPNYGQYAGIDNSVCFEKELKQNK